MKEEEKQKVVKWINEKCPNMKCECCGTKQWNLQDNIIAPPNIQNGSIAVGGNMTPQIMLICSKCGNTKYFNAVHIGIFQPSNPLK
jgi:hypothetical protein